MSSESARPLLEVALVLGLAVSIPTLVQYTRLEGPLSTYITQIVFMGITFVLVVSGRLPLSSFKPPMASHTPYLLALSAATVAVAQSAAYAVMYIGSPPQEYLENLKAITPTSPASLIILITLTWLVVAPAEETVFRGLVFRNLNSLMGFTPALVVSAALFSLAHLDIWRLLPTMAVGISTTMAYHRTGTLLA
ncbi:MAG: type II CAAX endopeptidase family protein, partial [Nitrososphaerota archaeon]